MTIIQDLGEVTGTTTEWTNRIHYADGSTKDGEPMTEDSARFAVDCVQAHLDAVAAGEDTPGFVTVPASGVELVSRTVTNYAGGHKLIGPWQVTE